MKLPKYRFYIGSLKHNFATRQGYINLSGVFVASQYYRASSLVAVPESGLVYIMNKPQAPDARISYYDANSSYLGYNLIKQGANSVISNASYYAITYNNSDSAFTNDYFLADLIQVTPHYKELKKKYAKESEQWFFRQTLDGKITLFGDDFGHIYNANVNDKFMFYIYKQNGQDGWDEYFKAKFSKTDCKFDFVKASCELKLSALDRYTDLINKYDNTYDLIKLAPAITKIQMYKRPIMQVYVAGESSISNFFGGTYWETDVNESVDSDDDLIKKYYFAYVSSGNEFVVSGASISGVNGQYAGTDGSWTNNKGYTCEAYDIVGTGGTLPDITLFRARIKQDSDGTILYQTGASFQISSGSKHQPVFNKDNVTMYRVKSDGTLDINDTCTISMTIVYNIYQRCLCDVDSITGTPTYDLPIDDFAVTDRNYKKCIGLEGGYFFCTSQTTTEPTKYGQNDYGEYFTNQFLPLLLGIDRLLPISRNAWANASLWYAYNELYGVWEQSLRKEYTLRDSYSIGAAIKALLKEIDPSLSHEETAEYSQFLYGDTSPIGLERFCVFITQKTNILKSQYDQAAQKAETSLEEIMNMLRNCFRCYWFIEDGKFKIEHISYFMNGKSYSTNTDVQLDLTSVRDNHNGLPILYGQGEIEYDKDELNARYEFNWMDDVTDLFSNFNVDVKSNYIQEDKVEKITVSQFTPDVDLMTLAPSSFAEDGFALLCPVKDGNTYRLPIVTVDLIDENKNSYEAIIQNWYASWLYLIRTYMYDMPATDIEYSSISSGLYVQRVKRCMRYSIEFSVEADPNERQLIRTSIGDGVIDEMSISIDTRMAEVDLIYEPS